jgi:hypothetical protein
MAAASLRGPRDLVPSSIYVCQNMTKIRFTKSARSTGMAWAMAQRFLGHGIWRPADRR